MKLSSKVLSLISFALGLGFMFAPLAYVSAAASISIQSLSPGTTVTPGNEVYFTVVGAGYGSSLTYSVADNVSGSTVSNNDFNNAGVFTWIPTVADAGTHTLTITVADQSGNTASATQQITVQGPPTATIQSLAPSSSVIVGQAVSFTTAASNFINPAYYVSDSFSGSSVNSSSITSTGAFSWTPIAGQDVGTHSIRVNVVDSAGHSASASQTITVGAGASISIQTLSPGPLVFPNQTLTFTVTPTVLTSPSYALADSFSGSSISNATISSASGAFTWTPTSSDVGTHLIAVHATDPYGRSANASVTIQVQASSTAAAAVPTAPATTTAATSASVSAAAQLQAQIQAATAALAAAQAAQQGGASSGTQSSAHVFIASLHPGMTSDEVVALQKVLAAQGFLSASATGYYGPGTEKAVRAFQAAHGLAQLGTVGPGTRAALNALSGSSAASASASASASSVASSSASAGDGYKFAAYLSVGSTGAAVTELQKRLAAEGFYSGSVTGRFGALTQAAVMAYQAKHGLAKLGVVGPGTRAMLNK